MMRASSLTDLPVLIDLWTPEYLAFVGVGELRLRGSGDVACLFGVEAPMAGKRGFEKMDSSVSAYLGGVLHYSS